MGRSKFITAMAWGLMLVTGLLFYIAVTKAIYFSGNIESVRVIASTENLSDITKTVLENIAIVFVGIAIFSFFTFVSSVAMLRRKNWSRMYFIITFVIGAVLLTINFIKQFVIGISAAWRSPPVSPTEYDRIQGGLTSIGVGVSVIFYILFLTLFIWLVRKLNSNQIKGEFEINSSRK